MSEELICILIASGVVAIGFLLYFLYWWLWGHTDYGEQIFLAIFSFIILTLAVSLLVFVIRNKELFKNKVEISLRNGEKYSIEELLDND